MFKTTRYLFAPVLAASLLWSVAPLHAEHEKSGQQCTANEMIGKKVKNLQDEDLGKIQDLVVNFENGTVPYAIIAHGGIFGQGRSKTAVSLDSLKPSADGKTLVLAATKEQLQAATRGSAGWETVAATEWAQNVDGFYGSPAKMERSRYGRDRFQSDADGRTYVRDPVPKGAELLMTPADAALCEKICESTEVVHVRVENGVTHLYGQVESEEARKNLEAKVRAVQGVNRVESHLKVKNP